MDISYWTRKGQQEGRVEEVGKVHNKKDMSAHEEFMSGEHNTEGRQTRHEKKLPYQSMYIQSIKKHIK